MIRDWRKSRIIIIVFNFYNKFQHDLCDYVEQIFLIMIIFIRRLVIIRLDCFIMATVKNFHPYYFLLYNVRYSYMSTYKQCCWTIVYGTKKKIIYRLDFLCCSMIYVNFSSISTSTWMIIADFIFKNLIEIEISILNIPVISAA